MKTTKKHYPFVFALLGITLLLFSNCKKGDDDTTTVKDLDGNVYKTVKIGNQEWFAENLRTTKYNNGTPIPNGHSNDWAALTTGAYAVYPHTDIEGLNSDAEVLIAYGALYNWYAVESGNLCPTGWRVPTNADLIQLIKYIDTTFNPDYWFNGSTAGGKLKSTRTSSDDNHPRWESPNTSATDEYGFFALPSGYRSSSTGNFFNIGKVGLLWSSTELHATMAWNWSTNYNFESVFPSPIFKRDGVSVRCLRDN